MYAQIAYPLRALVDDTSLHRMRWPLMLTAGIRAAVLIVLAACGAQAQLVAAREAHADAAQPPPPAKAHTDAEVVARIDRAMRQSWTDEKLTPSAPATGDEWCRRVYLDLVGCIPSIEELQRFARLRGPDRKRQLIDRLLKSDEYAEEYARNFASVWTNVLVGRAAINEMDATVDRAGMQQYLRQSLLANKPYDQLVRELITAVGSTRPGTENYNGATNFLVGALANDAVDATNKTSRIFLGQRIQCQQCHCFCNTQEQYWNFNAFFRQAKVSTKLAPGGGSYAVVNDEDFAGEGLPATPEHAEIYFQPPSGKLQVALPAYLDGTKINPSGLVSEVNRRAELARFVVQSKFFAPMIVNRTWSHFFGYGFTQVIDDLGMSVSHRALSDELSQEFVAHGYDMKRLLRWIALSEAYSLSSRPTAKNSKDMDVWDRPIFSHFYLRQMRAEQLYESMQVVARKRTVLEDYAQREVRKAALLQQFTLSFNNDEREQAHTFNGSVQQVLLMMNGELTTQAVAGTGELLQFLTTHQISQRDAIDLLYRATLSRSPTRAETLNAQQLLATAGNDTLAVFEDLLWALVNSNEFVLIH